MRMVNNYYNSNQNVSTVSEKFERTRSPLRQEFRNWILDHKNIQSVYNGSQRLSRMISSPLRILPDFLVIGVAKGGTSSLYEYMIRHPQVMEPMGKELGFFSNKFSNGTAWYKSNFPTKFTKNSLEKKFQTKNVLTGEASPFYIYHPLAPRRISKMLPNVKLIAILRNPIDRAYSHYQMNLRWNLEDLSFEEAIDAEDDRIKGEKEKVIANEDHPIKTLVAYSYLSRGTYADQLEEWFKYFSKEQFLILSSEFFYSETTNALKEIFAFLDLPPLKLDIYKNVNPGKYSKMIPETRKKLSEFFKPHNERLYKIIDQNFEWD